MCSSGAVIQAARRERFDLVDDEPLAADDPPPTDVEHLHRGLELVLGQPDHVEVLGRGARPPSAGARWPAAPWPGGRAGRLLELQLGGRAPHLGVEALDDRLGVAVQEVGQLVDELAVADLVDLADARAESSSSCGQGVAGRVARGRGTWTGCRSGSGTTAAARRACRGWHRRGRTARSSGCPCLRPHDERPGPLLVDRDGQERVACSSRRRTVSGDRAP